MANVNKINIREVNYDLEDSWARANLLEKQSKQLEIPLTIVGQLKTTVEEALQRLAFNTVGIFNNTGFHSSVYRGEYLGNQVTAEQYNAIDAGTFDDLYIGDYWTIGGIDYVIADFDYWYNCGDTACLKHHVVVVPRVALYNAKMNDSNTTTGGYIGSQMYTTYLADAKNTIKTAFGPAHILVHRELFTNAVSNGIPTAGAWVDSDIDLPNEPMLYGSYIFSAVTNGTAVPYINTIDKSQLALYRYRPDLIGNRQTVWLRDVVSASLFAYVHYYGNAYFNDASNARGVRPPFGLVKSNN